VYARTFEILRASALVVALFDFSVGSNYLRQPAEPWAAIAR
jgi:hypothetical protein